jgi:hypothetical protein
MLPDHALHTLDALQARVMRQPLAGRLTLLSRLLLALAFLPTGLVKVMGQRFTVLGPDSPVGAFFEAMYQTGGYWRFLGASQLLAAVLLLIPSTAFFGALLFLPIIVNVAVITTAIEFRGTIYITWLMVLATLWLLAWDWPRWRTLLLPTGYRAPLLGGATTIERVGWGLGAAAGIGAVFATRGMVPMRAVPILLGVGVAAGGLVLIGLLRTRRRSSS